MKTLAAMVRDSGEGERRWFCGGGLHTWKATSDETGGAFLMFEDRLDEGIRAILGLRVLAAIFQRS